MGGACPPCQQDDDDDGDDDDDDNNDDDDNSDDDDDDNKDDDDDNNDDDDNDDDDKGGSNVPTLPAATSRWRTSWARPGSSLMGEMSRKTSGVNPCPPPEITTCSNASTGLSQETSSLLMRMREEEEGEATKPIG